MSKPLDFGPVGRNVATNVKRLRLAQRLSFRVLVDRLTELGQPIPLSNIYKIESLDRRVSVDELVALATVFGVPPSDLLADAPKCGNCNGEPPAGYRCRTCGAEA